MEEIIITRKDGEVIACIYTEDNKVSSFVANGYEVLINGVKMEKE